MSHVAKLEIEVKSLDALELAAQRLGLELVRGQTSYKWYGRSVGDYPLPQGMTTADLGKCHHAIRIPGNSQAYEIGVRQAGDGTFNLLWDFWQGGFGLQEAIGKDGLKLTDAYATEAAIQELERDGFRVFEERGEDGRIELTATR